MAVADDTARVRGALEALAELGPALTSNIDFRQTARKVLDTAVSICGSRCAVLFRVTDKPLMLRCLASTGFTQFPEDAVIPLLPKHSYALAALRSARELRAGEWPEFFTPDGTFDPTLLRWMLPLKVGRKLVGLLGLGEHSEGANYSPESLRSLETIGHYIALAVHNQSLTETLAERVSDNLKMLSGVHTYYDSTLEALARAIDVKHVDNHGHSMRVGAYAACIGQALGLGQNDTAGVRAAGYLHDIGYVVVDRYIFAKPSALDAEEFRQMIDHTTLGYQIVKDVQFPWPGIPEVVRSHHERADGTGYPDGTSLDEMRPEVKIIALADAFDAMTSERPYRRRMSVGEALVELVRLTPAKFDPESMQALLLEVRRDAVAAMPGPATSPYSAAQQRPRFLDERLTCNLFPGDVDQIAAQLNHKLTFGRSTFDLLN